MQVFFRPIANNEIEVAACKREMKTTLTLSLFFGLFQPYYGSYYDDDFYKDVMTSSDYDMDYPVADPVKARRKMRDFDMNCECGIAEKGEFPQDSFDMSNFRSQWIILSHSCTTPKKNGKNTAQKFRANEPICNCPFKISPRGVNRL